MSESCLFFALLHHIFDHLTKSLVIKLKLMQVDNHHRKFVVRVHNYLPQVDKQLQLYVSSACQSNPAVVTSFFGDCKLCSL